MDSKDLDKLNLDLKQFFDFANHNHIYYFHIWKGQFSLREMRSAATYSEIADRFEFAIPGSKKFASRTGYSVFPNVEQRRIA